jgi:ubiquinol-cytochrome c reductase cytochrome c1 subunit
MADSLRALLAVVAFLCCVPAALGEEEAPWMAEAHVDLHNEASLQRGAKYFVNYCLGCHSARYVRYSRVGQDLGIDPQQLSTNLMFTADKPQQTMEIAMPPADAKRWFGRTPPDLSLVARSRGGDWIYNYLRTFYLDDSKPWGVNNLTLPNAAMPHVLWELQGLQRAVFREEKDAQGHPHSVFERFEPATAGSLTQAQYDAVVRDIVAFLTYVGEPGQLERRHLGLSVLAYLGVLFVIAYALKKEYWKDVH